MLNFFLWMLSSLFVNMCQDLFIFDSHVVRRSVPTLWKPLLFWYLA